MNPAALEGPAWLTGSLDWIQANPVEAALVLALACAVEGLFLIGMVIPGSALMFAAGAVAVAGEIPLGPVLVVAALGAWLGDCLSYAIGARYRAQLPAIAARLRMPGAIARGEDFFARHGGKSILLGRFIGPLRPLVPAIAGAAAMRPGFFITVDLIAALIWAPAYALPGVLVGATLSLAAEITTRFALLLGGALAVTWLLWWLVSRSVRLGQRHAEPWLLRTMDWSHKHRRLGNLGPALTDPNQPETPVLAGSLLALAGLLWLAGYAWWHWPGSAIGPPALDDTVYDTLASLLGSGSGAMALYLDAIGSLRVNLLLGLALLLLFAGLRRPRLAAHWMAGLCGGALLGLCLPGSGVAIGPEAVLGPTASMALSLTLWMCLAGLLTTRHGEALRITVYVATGLLLGLILLAKLMLGQVSFSQALLAVPATLLWSSLLVLGFRRHLRTPRPMPVSGPLAMAASVTLALLILQPPQPSQASQIIWEQAERSPARINLHWLGTALAIDASLREAGWQALPPAQGRDFLNWLLPRAELASLPLAPQWLAGRQPDLRYRLRSPQGRELILRLWQDREQRWLGQVGELRLRHWAGLMRVPVTQRTDEAVALLIAAQSDRWTVSRTRRETTLYILAPPPN